MRKTSLAVLLAVAAVATACASGSGGIQDSASAILTNPDRVATLRGKLTADDGDSVRIVELASTSVFLPSHKAIPGCTNGGYLGAPAPGHEDGKLVHFNRATVDGNAFSVEVPVTLGSPINLCGYQRSEATVLHLTALTDDGARVKLDVPLDIDPDAGDGRSELDVRVQGDATESVAVHQLDTRVSLAYTSFPAQAKTNAGESSFSATWAKVTAARRDSLPTQIAASDEEISAAVFGNTAGADTRSARLREDQARVLSQTGDEKPEGIKAFHPFGACSKAIWRIDEETPFSGLFEKGTQVNAIVRFSAAGNNATTTPALGLIPRLLGIAVKLFPAPSDDATTETKNFVTFDQHGPHGNPSPYFFQDESGTKTIFSNWLFGNDPIAHGNVAMFARALRDPQHQDQSGRAVPLTPLATVRGDGAFVKAPELSVPRFLKLVATKPAQTAQTRRDFQDIRDELVTYQDGDIEMGIHLFGQDAADGDAILDASKRIGVLTAISQPILSDYCDRVMQFHHAPQ